MDIYTFKAQFESRVQPAPRTAPIAADQAWAYFLEVLPERPDKTDFDEVGFSASVASRNQGREVIYDENLFQIYFGRLIDASAGQSWQMAEINFYYRYAMNSELRALLAEPAGHEIEVAYGSVAEVSAGDQKIEALRTFVEARSRIWEAVRALPPTLASYHFWIW